MVEGFWIVQYEGIQGGGGGVVMFIKGRVFGGDSGSTYSSTYEADTNRMTARVRIHNYLPGVRSIIGIDGDYDLEVTGTIEGDVIKAAGTPLGQQATGMRLRLTKIEEIPC